MAVNYTKPPATAAITRFCLSRIPSFHLLNSTIAALVWVPLICVGSHAVDNTKGTRKLNPFSLTRLVISADLQDPDYTSDYVPKKKADLDRAGISSARLLLYCEVVMLVFAIPIAIATIMSRGRRDEEFHAEPHSTDVPKSLPSSIPDRALR
jgi:hypothetical protein